MKWIDIKNELPITDHPEKTISVVMIDNEAGLGPYVGWFDPSEKGGGFYVREGIKPHRVIVTHYIILPDRNL